MDYVSAGRDYYGGFYSSSTPLILGGPVPPSNEQPLVTHDVHPASTSPAYYTEGRRYEPAKVIADWGLGYNPGTILSYVSRLGRKPPEPGQTRAEKDVDDLRKIIRHAELEIEAIWDRQP